MVRWEAEVRRVDKTNSILLGKRPAYEVTSYHTHDCLKAKDDYAQRAEHYRKSWPDYCVYCNGAGGFPASSEYGYPEFDPCLVCTYPDDLEDAKCPRCGKKWLDILTPEFKYEVDHGDPLEHISTVADYVEVWLEAEEPCPSCGWNFGFGEGDALPQEPTCGCFRIEGRPRGGRTKC